MADSADSSAWNSLQRFDAALEKLESLLLLVLLFGLIGFGCAQIVLRNFGAHGIGGVDPVMRVAVLWIALLGAMLASRRHRHVSVDVLSRYLGPTSKWATRILIDGFTALVCGLIAWHAGRLVYFEYTAPTLAFAGFPVWIAQSIIPVGFGVMSVRYGFGLLAALGRRPAR